MLAAALLLGAATGCGGVHQVNVTRHVVDPSTGISVALPAGWRLNDDLANGPGAVMLSTYAVRRPGDVGETPPQGRTWLLLWDGGPIWALPGWARQLRPLPWRLPAENGYEGFGSARRVVFRTAGHEFLAFAKGKTGSDVLAILGSIRVTPFGRSLALVITRRTVEGVQVWRVGNPRSGRRLIVVGCPRLARGCSGFAVTNRLVNGPAPLAADLWVIQQLRGREDVLARLEHQLRPEATIRLGSINNPDPWTRRIVALAR